MTPKTVTNPVYAISSHEAINVMVTWEEMPNEPPMPFSATSYDVEPYGVDLYNQLQAGIYGPIGQFTGLSISPSNSKSGVVGQSYEQILTGSDAIGDYTISKLGQLPSGLDIVNNAIVGIPTLAGTYNFLVFISDSNNNIGTPSIRLVVS